MLRSVHSVQLKWRSPSMPDTKLKPYNSGVSISMVCALWVSFSFSNGLVVGGTCLPLDAGDTDSGHLWSL